MAHAHGRTEYGRLRIEAVVATLQAMDCTTGDLEHVLLIEDIYQELNGEHKPEHG